MFCAGKKLKTILALCAALLLAHCASPGATYENVRSNPNVTGGTAFQMALYREYMGLAEKQYYMGRHGKADFYARRAGMAVASDLVMPLEINMNKTPAEALPAMQDARVRMIRAITAGGQEKEPQRTARALAHFDCWAGEVGTGDYIVNVCRDAFARNIADVETRLKECAPAPLQQSMLPFAMEDETVPEIFTIEY